MFGSPPNIVGAVWSIAGTGGNGIGSNSEGALYPSHKSNSDVTYGQTGSSGANDCVNIDASRSSTYYTGDKLQVSSLQVLACIKI